MKQKMALPSVVLAGVSILTLLVLMSCDRSIPAEPLVLNDFESSADLQRIAWRCRTTFTLSNTYRSHGQSGLSMELYPDAYPGLHLLLTPKERRWRGYRYLALEVFNPGRERVSLAYRIDDRANPDYADRVNGSFALDPGLNHLRLDLSQMRTSGSKRGLNLDRIDQLLFFLVAPLQPVVLAVDYIRLEPDVFPK